MKKLLILLSVFLFTNQAFAEEKFLWVLGNTNVMPHELTAYRLNQRSELTNYAMLHHPETASSMFYFTDIESCRKELTNIYVEMSGRGDYTVVRNDLLGDYWPSFILAKHDGLIFSYTSCFQVRKFEQ